MLLPLSSPVQLPLGVQALYRLSAAAVCSQIQPLAVQPPFPGQHTPFTEPERFFSTSSSSESSWLPASVTRLIKRQQRGQHNFPTNPLQPGQISPTRSVPDHIPRPHYATAKAAVSGGSKGPGLSKQPEIMSDEASRAAMRAAGQLAAQALQVAGSMALPGTTTDDIDVAVHDFLISKGAYPSPLYYHGFPKSICTSVNEVVCHGGCRYCTALLGLLA
jgi:methionyl aminopeptidase